MAKRRNRPTLTFEKELTSKLINTTSTTEFKQTILEGHLAIGTRVAKIKIILPKNIQELRVKPPSVFCSEPFIRYGEEWHNSDKSGLCYVIDLEWQEYMGWLGKDREQVIKEAARWLIIASQNLIIRHRVASKRGYLNWPEKWKYWEHGSVGYEQYKKENQ